MSLTGLMPIVSPAMNGEVFVLPLSLICSKADDELIYSQSLTAQSSRCI